MNSMAKSTRMLLVATAVCLVCLSITGWTWMRFSYCHYFDIEHIADMPLKEGFWPDRAYVRVTGLAGPDNWPADSECKASMLDCGYIVNESYLRYRVFVTARGSSIEPDGEDNGVHGRLYLEEHAFESIWGGGEEILIDLRTNHSRWHAASIVGLIFGAIGIGVFALALREWLRGSTAA